MKIESTTRSLLKQDFKFANSDGVCRAVLWEEKVASIQAGRSYKFHNATVKEFNHNRYLSISTNSNIDLTHDLGDVDDTLTDDQQSSCEIVKGEIVNLVKYNTYSGCRVCKSKLPDAEAIDYCFCV